MILYRSITHLKQARAWLFTALKDRNQRVELRAKGPTLPALQPRWQKQVEAMAFYAIWQTCFFKGKGSGPIQSNLPASPKGSFPWPPHMRDEPTISPYMLYCPGSQTSRCFCYTANRLKDGGHLQRNAPNNPQNDFEHYRLKGIGDPSKP